MAQWVEHYRQQATPMLTPGTITYEVGGYLEATPYGGLAVMHRLVTKLGLVDAINERVRLLEIHLPHHESDHVLNMAYNEFSSASPTSRSNHRRCPLTKPGWYRAWMSAGYGAHQVTAPTKMPVAREVPVKPSVPRSNRDQNRVWRPACVPGLEVGMKRSPVGLEFLPAPVVDYRFVLNGHGSGRARFGSQSYRMGDVRGVVFLQHPGEVFQGTFDGPSGASGACLGLSEDLVAELQGEQPTDRWRFPSMVLPDRDNAMLAALIRVALCAVRGPASLLERQARLLALVQAALRSSATWVDSVAWTQGSERRAVAVVRDCLADSPGLDHSMQDLARLTGLNPRYLIGVFRQQTGLTPHRYLTVLRVRSAKGLLLTDQPMSSIATDLGFSDQAHFIRVFKAYVQVTPGEFRRMSAPLAAPMVK